MSSGGTTLAFFGATGGCALTCLVLSLNTGYECRALSRSSSKLLNLVHNEGVPTSVTDKLLTVVQGAGQDEVAVKKVLQFPDGRLVGRIVFAIGGKPVYSGNPLLPVTNDDKTVCQTSMSCLLTSIGSLPYTKKPLLTVVSSMGLSKRRDVPLILAPLYHWALHTALEDKRKMDQLIEDARSNGTIAGFCITYNSLLTDGKAAESSIKSGEDPNKPVIGYSISRKSVGSWIFSNLVKGDESSWGLGSEGRRVWLSY